jgi:hypothetical protein
MSVYQVEKLCHRALHEPAFRGELKRDPEGVLATLPLTDEERDLLLQGEVGRLYEMGAHPYLLSHISRMGLFDVSGEQYRARMRAVDEQVYAHGPPRVRFSSGNEGTSVKHARTA